MGGSPFLHFTRGSLFLKPRACLSGGLGLRQILATWNGRSHDHLGAFQKCRPTGSTAEMPKDSCAHGSLGGNGSLTCGVGPRGRTLTICDSDGGEFWESAPAWAWMPAACGYGGPLSGSCCHWAASRTAQTSQVVLGRVRPRTKGSGAQAA